MRLTVWWKNIDNVFTTWPYEEECFETFFTINFTAKWSYRPVSLLDVKIILNEGHLTMDLYTKPTDTDQYLHQQSCHPRHCKATIAYGQAFHLRRTCSLEEDYPWSVEELKLHLVNQGHGEMEIQRQIDRANKISRKQALQKSGKNTTDRIPLVLTYHPDLPLLNKILRDHLPILHVSERMKLAAPSPTLVANRQLRNLKDLLTKATLKPLQRHTGSHGCGRLIIKRVSIWKQAPVLLV